MSNSFEQHKAQRREELLKNLERKKKELQSHLAQTANNSVELGKGLLAIGAGVLVLYTIFDRFLEAKFRPLSVKKNQESSSKNTSQKLLLPFYSMLLQQGSSVLFNAAQDKLIHRLKKKKGS